MSKYGYEKHDAGAIGQFVVTITTPDGVLGGVLFTHTESAAAEIARILNADTPMAVRPGTGGAVRRR